MKKITKKILIISPLVLIISFISLILPSAIGLVSAQEIKMDATDFTWQHPTPDTSKKTILIIADNKRTEIFDMMAPYYLFNRTGRANVYIVAEKKEPVSLWKGLFVLPHFSFKEIDSLHIKADVIVLPNESIAIGKPQNPVVVKWIKDHYSTTTIVLSVCDGAATAAATGLYDGKPITTHSSDFDDMKKQYSRPLWVQQVSFTQSGNLFSTAGVSNAVEGSLAVIKELFGEETMQEVLTDINYPSNDIKTEHQNNVVDGKSLSHGLLKVILKKNNKIGVLLQNGMNELELAAVLDCYNRTFPSFVHTYTTNNKTVVSKYGLVLIPTGSNTESIDELHIINPSSFTLSDPILFKGTQLIPYDNKNAYILDRCLDRIKFLYGVPFQNFVKLTLDYN